MRLLVVIVNYRTADLTIDCLRTVRAELGSLSGTQIVVTDNASGNDSPGRIASAIASNDWSQWAKVIPLANNGGFAFGNNAAIRPALQSVDPPGYILLLNPDTLLRPGAIRQLLDFMESHPQVGIAGSRLEDPDGTPQRSAFRFPTPLSELEDGARVGFLTRLLKRRVVAPPVPTTACPVDWVAGASMMIRKAVFGSIGLLDEAYFMYYEEVDFCRRAKRAGWPCWYVPESRVVHLVGQSSGITDAAQSRKRRPAYWFASRRRYFLTHFGPAQTLLADILWAAGFAQWRLRRRIMRAPEVDADQLLSDFVQHSLAAADWDVATK